MINGRVIPYPTGVGRLLVRLPIWMYRTGLGELLNAANIMILTTRGRKSGLPRYTPIEYRRHGSKIYVISGWDERPNWYQNIAASPEVIVQQGRQSFSAEAVRVTDPSEALRALNLFRRTAPFVYDPVLARMSNRETINPRVLPDVSDKFTIVRFDIKPIESGLSGLRADYAWVWAGLLAFGLVGALVLSWTRQRETN
jgi:deazaflavin-dependent oxidoreductase (nitroreductase family)